MIVTVTVLQFANSLNIQYVYTYHDAPCSQDWIVAFMMGTHARLRVDSPLRLLDDHLVASIAHMAIDDKW